jgi:hypothetical protein
MKGAESNERDSQLMSPSYTALVLTGDINGFNYIKKSAPKVKAPTTTGFTFCCSSDASVKGADVNFGKIRPSRPEKRQSMWTDDLIESLLKGVEQQKMRMTNVLSDMKINKMQFDKLIQSMYVDIHNQNEEMRRTL